MCSLLVHPVTPPPSLQLSPVSPSPSYKQGWLWCVLVWREALSFRCCQHRLAIEVLHALRLPLAARTRPQSRARLNLMPPEHAQHMPSIHLSHNTKDRKRQIKKSSIAAHSFLLNSASRTFFFFIDYCFAASEGTGKEKTQPSLCGFVVRFSAKMPSAASDNDKSSHVAVKPNKTTVDTRTTLQRWTDCVLPSDLRQRIWEMVVTFATERPGLFVSPPI